MKTQIKTIARTAVMLAVLISVQAVTASMGQLVTGSCVNLVLATTALVLGFIPGLALAVLSPFFAFFLGIGPAFLPLVPGIAAGNTLYVLVLCLCIGKTENPSALKKTLGLGAAAVSKFGILFLLVVKLILPLLELNAKQTAMITASFSWPQLITALIGGSLALVIYPRLKKIK